MLALEILSTKQFMNHLLSLLFNIASFSADYSAAEYCPYFFYSFKVPSALETKHSHEV